MILVLLLAALLGAAVYFLAQYKYPRWALAVLTGMAAAWYAVLLTSGDIRTLFANDPYSGIYPNLWEHALSGDFGIDPKRAFREYFITDNGMPTVYFGFMPALLRGLASLFAIDTYRYNLGNLSIIIAMLLSAVSVIYALQKLKLLEKHVRKYSVGVLIALLLASPLVYTAIWGRVHNEVIAWGAAWGIIFVSFFMLWVYGEERQRSYWWTVVMGLSLGMAVMARPTVALMLGVAFAYISCAATWHYWRTRRSTDFKLLLPGILCAVLCIGTAMYINQVRWGSPITFVKMHRHVELLKENPKRGESLKKAGEFNMNRVPSSFAYYFVPGGDNLTKQWPFIHIDQSLKIMNGAPQYDYIEGSRVPVVLSMMFLGAAALLGTVNLRRFKKDERYAAIAMVAGGGIMLLALCAVYAVALRYSVDLVPLALFCAMLYLVVLSRERTPKPVWWQCVWHGLLAVSIVLSTITTLQYKIISGQIGLSQDFRRNLSQRINFPMQPDAKLFIINGEAAPAVRY